MKGLGRDKIYTMESYFYKANCFQACRIGSTIITIETKNNFQIFTCYCSKLGTKLTVFFLANNEQNKLNLLKKKKKP